MADSRDSSPFVENPDLPENDNNGTTSNTDYDYSFTFSDWYFLVTFLIDAGLVLADIAALIFLICMILKHKRLRIRPNYYIMNIAIGFLFFFFFYPILVILDELVLYSTFAYELRCYIALIYESGLFFSLAVSLALGIDWYLVTYSPRIVHLHKKFYGAAIGLVYGFVIVRYFILTAGICSLHGYRYSHFFTNTSYCLIALVLTGLNYLRYKRRNTVGAQEGRRTRYSIPVANVVVFFWLPRFIFSMLVELEYHSVTAARVLFFLETIPAFIAHSSGIVLVYMLGKWDKHFQMAYDIAFKRKSRNYEQDDLDAVSDEEEEEGTQHQLPKSTVELGKDESDDREGLVY